MLCNKPDYGGLHIWSRYWVQYQVVDIEQLLPVKVSFVIQGAPSIWTFLLKQAICCVFAVSILRIWENWVRVCLVPRDLYSFIIEICRYGKKTLYPLWSLNWVQHPVFGSELQQVTDGLWRLSSRLNLEAACQWWKEFFVCIIILEGYRLNYCVEQKTFFLCLPLMCCSHVPDCKWGIFKWGKSIRVSDVRFAWWHFDKLQGVGGHSMQSSISLGFVEWPTHCLRRPRSKYVRYLLRSDFSSQVGEKLARFIDSDTKLLFLLLFMGVVKNKMLTCHLIVRHDSVVVATNYVVNLIMHKPLRLILGSLGFGSVVSTGTFLVLMHSVPSSRLICFTNSYKNTLIDRV